MERLLLESAVRAVLIAAGTGFVLWAFGVRSATARHRAWTGVVLVMLLLPLWTAAGPKVSLKILRPPAPPPGEIGSAPAFNDSTAVAIQSTNAIRVRGEQDSPVADPSRPLDWRLILRSLYLLGVGVMLLRLALGTVRARRLIREAVIKDGYRISKSCVLPITVGWLRPVVILPQAWQQWPKAQLDAVLTHEAQHVRRYDPLIQWVAMLNRAVFWFHPLAWWLELRLAAFAEEACDVAVLSAGHTPQEYSEYLLDLARSTMHAGRHMRVVGSTMPGRCLTRRIQQIFRGVPMQPISRIRFACMIVLCAISSVIFATATPVPQQIPPVDSKAALAPVVPAQPTAVAAVKEPEPQLPEPPRPSLPNARRIPTPAPTPVAVVAQQPPSQSPPEDQLNGLWAARSVTQKEAVGWRIRPQMQQEVLTWRNTTTRWQIWLPNPFLLSRLGLTDEQKTKITAMLESYNRNIAARQEQIEKEESLYNTLLEADQVDRNAALAQFDRVIQARAEMERANAAMILEMRESLTQAQWIQLQNDKLYGLTVKRIQWPIQQRGQQ